MNHTSQRHGLLLLAVALCCAQAQAANVLLVTKNSGSLSTGESQRKSRFESWGHTVTTIGDNDSQSNFNAAMSAVDVVYIPVTIQEWELASKVKATDRGVVCEERYMDIHMGFSTTLGWNSSYSQTQVLDNSHPVTSGLSSGYVSIVSSSSDLALMKNTIAAGMTVLSKQNLTEGNMLGVIEAGGALAGGGTAAGRRVRMPWGGDGFNWSSLNSNGLLIARQALDWAGAGGDPLLLHWKLDEASGSTAADASGYGRDGTVTGTTSWATGRRCGALDLTAGARASVNDLLGEPSSFTVAAWVNLESKDTNGAEVISIGDYVILRLDGSYQGDLPAIMFYNGVNWEELRATESVLGDGWRHFVATFNDSTNTLSIYVDGVLSATKTTTESIEWSGLGTQTIAGGHANGESTYDFDGQIDDVRVYNYALTNEEIAVIHGLVAHWKLDESSGSTATDSTLAGNDASGAGTQAWTSGVENGAHEFDYTDGEDHFTAPTGPTLDDVQEDDYTVMAYFKPGSIPPGSGSDNDAAYQFIGKRGWHMGLYYISPGTFYMDHWLDGNSWSGVYTTDATYDPGRFYHVAGVVSRTNGTVRIYVDGVLSNESTFTPDTSTRDYGVEPWRIGIGYPGASTWGRACHGVIDDARVYNRALSEEELARFATPGLVGHWRLDETSGGTAVDSSPKLRDGAYTGGVSLDQDAPYPGVTSPEFDGSNDHVDLPDLTENFGGGFSAAMWVKPTDRPGGGQYFAFLDLSNGANTDQVWIGWVNTVGFQLYMTDTADGASARTIEDNTNFTVGQWTHCVVTVDESGYATLYRNGKVTKSDFYVSLPTNVTRTQVSIGNANSNDPFAGSLYDVRVYNYGLSEAEVSELYGLVGHWRFDEGAGADIADDSGVGNDAQFHAGTPNWVSGVRGGALEFDGSSSAQTTADFDPPEVGAVVFWFRQDGQPASRERLWGLGGDYEMWQDPDGLVSSDVSVDGYQGGFITTEPLYDTNRWYHLVAQYDSSDDSYEIYIDGQLHKSGVSTWDIKKQAANLLSFGTRTGSNQYFSGSLDDFRIYNRKLSAQDIVRLYGLVGHWKLDEPSGTTAFDSSGLENNGAYVSTVELGQSVPSPAAGPTGARFSGSGVVQIDSSNDYNMDQGLSIAAWVYAEGGDDRFNILAFEELGQYSLAISDDRSPEFTLNLGRPAGYSGTFGGGTDVTISWGAWRHLAASYDGMEVAYYLDGIEVDRVDASGITLGYEDSAIFLGQCLDSSVAGRLHDVRLYNRPIVPAEARSLYYGGYMSGLRIRRWVEMANP